MEMTTDGLITLNAATELLKDGGEKLALLVDPEERRHDYCVARSAIAVFATKVLRQLVREYENDEENEEQAVEEQAKEKEMLEHICIVIGIIRGFQANCREMEYTDTGEAWDLLNRIDELLFPFYKGD